MNKIQSEQFSAWNPGLSSKIPASLQPEVTLFRAQSSIVDYQQAEELSDFCGLNAAELIAFRVERLVIHELLVRVTSDLFVPDGPNYEDLGISLRSMVANIYENYAVLQLPAMQESFDREVAGARKFIESELSEKLFRKRSATQEKGSFFNRIFKKSTQKKGASQYREPAEFTALASWQKMLDEERDSHKRECLQALVKTINSIVGHRGRVVNQPELIATIATHMAANTIGSDLVSGLLAPVFNEAAAKEDYQLLPAQEKPVVMNVKGASASGKSTIRSRQRELAEDLEIPWDEFAVISPDYWRKYLLDYNSLGDDYKYAAMLTGQELEIIDKKLDRYMGQKARQGQIPHLLIDRFRFDSFSVERGRSQDSKLLSRFGDRIYLFFMVTSPVETVVRAWERGNTTGRYKAVDDLLYHNIEAFTGMPALFFSWVLSNDKPVHFEFLNNDVPKGELPGTIAFGRNNSMTILDLQGMCNIDRYRMVNVDAKLPSQVLVDSAKTTHTFLKRCLSKLSEVRFANAESGEVYARFSKGELTIPNPNADPSEDVQALRKILEELFDTVPSAKGDDTDIGLENVLAEKNVTLGHWGAS